MKTASADDQHENAPHTIDREYRMWWAVNDESVVQVKGYTCAPNSPGMWWCPGIGYSLTEGHHLFTTEAAAVSKLIEELERRSTEIEERLIALRVRRSALKL